MSERPPRQVKQVRSPIPRSRSDFCYVNLTPKEKRRTTDFSHLLPQFNRDPPYVRLLDPKVPIVEQPTISKPMPSAVTRVCRSATGQNIAKSPTLDVIRSQSMRSLRRTLDLSPTKPRYEGLTNKYNPEPVPDVQGNDPSPDDKDLTRLRNFSTTPKGLVNWGDSFRSRSMPFVPGAGPSSSADLRPSSSGQSFEAGIPRHHSIAAASACCMRSPVRYRIVILGSSNVGKTTMIKQFRTSEYICAFDSGNSSNDESNDYAITVVLNGEESDLEFVDSCSLEEETEEEEANDDVAVQAKPYIPTADAYVVVYSVTSRRSFLHGLRLVSRIQSIFLSSVVLLVGNKSDLVRIRAVTTDEGRCSARERNCRFLETSVALNHQVDELLVAILSDLRSTTQVGSPATKMGSPHHCSLDKAKGLLKKFLKKACFQSKSCDNLQRL